LELFSIPFDEIVRDVPQMRIACEGGCGAYFIRGSSASARMRLGSSVRMAAGGLNMIDGEATRAVALRLVSGGRIFTDI
jgi:hypothetical protein